MGRAEPSLLPGRPDLLAEVVYAVRREQARTVGDVVLRRTRLGLTAARQLLAPESVLERVAGVMGAELGWDDARRARSPRSAWKRVTKASCRHRRFPATLRSREPHFGLAREAIAP